MAPFYLLRLPIVVIAEVLKNVQIIGLIELAQSSRKMSKLIKLGAKNRYNFSFDVGSHNHIEIDNYQKSNFFNIPKEFPKEYLKISCFEKFQETKNPRKFGMNSVEVAIGPIDYFTYWDDVITGIQEIGQFLMDTFGCRFEDIAIWGDYRNIFDWISRNQGSAERLKLRLGRSKNDEVYLQQFLSDFKTQDLTLIANLSENFRLHPKFVPQKVIIFEAIWFSGETLMNFHWRRLYAQSTRLSNRHFDRFLRKWKAGELPELEFLLISSKHIENQTEICGMVPPIGKKGDEKKENLRGLYEHDNSFIINLSKGIEIQTDDGSMKATIQVKPRGEFSFYAHR